MNAMIAFHLPVPSPPIRMPGGPARPTAGTCRIFLLILAMLWLQGCARAPAPSAWHPPDLAFAPGETRTCAEGTADKCAEPTPFRALVDKAAAAADSAPEHYVGLLEIGEEALLLRVHLIRAARKSIYIQQYIWSADASGLFLFRELVKAAQRGVEVKIVSDQLSTLSDAKLMASMVTAHRNLAFKIYNPTFGQLETSYVELAAGGLLLSGVNRRMHNKLMVVDQEIAILGGRNHEDRYFDLDPSYDFKDRDIFVIGPAVADMVFSFREFWSYDYSVPAQYLRDVGRYLESGQYPVFEVQAPPPLVLREIALEATDERLIRETFVTPALRVAGRVEFHADAPGKPGETAGLDPARPIKSSYQGILDLGREARHELIVQTPYLLLRDEAAQQLKQLRKAHPDLRIVASTNSLASIDHFFAYSIMVKQRKRLLQALGFQVYEFKPLPGDVRQMVPRYDRLLAEAGGHTMAFPDRMPVATEGPIIGLHGKSIVVDGRIALVGSHNFDPRSAIFDTQANVAIWDREVARALKANILRDTEPQNSWVVARQREVPVISFFAGIVETISRALPVLDLWPFQYSANFELREGEKPVPPDDPSFYERYDNVGQFPEVDRPLTVIQTMLMRAMGGFATPAM